MKKFIITLKIIGFYFLSFTWGIMLTSVGCLAAVGLILTKHKPHLFYQNIYFEVGNNWGGVNLGAFFITSKGSSIETKKHLAGHGIQNAILGVFMPLLVTIPSGLSLILRKINLFKNKKLFAMTFFLVLEAFIMALCTIGFFVNIDLMHICCCIIVYMLPLFVWFLAQELPRHQTENGIIEQALIEKTATQLGEKFYK